MTEFPKGAEGSKESKIELLKQQIKDTRDQIRTTRSTFDSSMVSILLTQPQEKIPSLIKVIKRSQMAVLPVTRETRKYASPREIEAGVRTRHETYPVFKNLFERLTIQAVSRLPHPEREKDNLITPIKTLDKNLYDSKPEIPFHYTTREAHPEYKEAIKQIADLLVQINPEDEKQKRELTLLLETIYRWPNYMSSASRDFSDDNQAKIAEDLFQEVLSRLKVTGENPKQETPDQDESTTLDTMASKSHSEESRLDEQLDELWRELDSVNKRG